MFENLSSRLSKVVKMLTGQARLTDANIKDTMREVRLALIEADVALPIVKHFVETLQERAIGKEVSQSLTPGQTLIKIVRDELTNVMGEKNESLALNTQPPAVILMAGLQGSGKTTTAAKLARLLKERHKKHVMVASCDIYRPAAIEQLATLAQEVGVTFFPSTVHDYPITIAQNAIKEAKLQAVDVVIIDTAGRLHIDAKMMDEIKAIHHAINPIETLFVVDSMTGQDAANTAKAFDAALPLTGIILTKADGDSRGGAALSIRHITNKPIKFLGVGEKTQALEPFYPDRLASRILGMGDMLSLIEEVERKVDKEKAAKMAKKLEKGGFDLEDFRDQLGEMRKMGGLTSLIEKLPGISLPAANLSSVMGNQQKQLNRFQAIIDSMTIEERRNPDLIKGSRKKRIASGSGTEVQDVNRLLSQFGSMQKIVKKMGKKGGLKKMMQSVQGMMQGGGGFQGM